MLKYITSILFLLLTLPAWAQQDTSARIRRGGLSDRAGANNSLVDTSLTKRDSALTDTGLSKPDTNLVDSSLVLSDTARKNMLARRDSLHQFRISFDISKPLMKLLVDDSLSFRESFEFEIDYYYKKELYWVAEGGWGSARVEYPDLRYSTKNTFFKAGINKSLLMRRGIHDWDQAFIGARYAVAVINRSDAHYETDASYWGKTFDTIPGKNIVGHWFEITAGTRLEVWNGIFIGWNIRGKFRLNRKPFQELPPYYIAGYGKGDKNSIFDFNFYLSYAIQWQ